MCGHGKGQVDMTKARVDGGFVLFARKMLESEIMEKPPLYLKLFVWMVMQAKFRPHKGLERGQLKASIKDMQEAMAYYVGYRKETPTVKQVRKVYEGLTKGHMIGHTKGTDGMIITILNYDKYQNPKNYEGHDEGHDEGEKVGTPYNKEEREERKNDIGTVNTVPVNGTDVPPTPGPKNCPHKEIRDLYNQTLGDTLPQIKITTTTFDKMLRTRWRESKDRQTLDWWTKYFNYIRESDFLMGRTDNDFMASFEWVIRPTNMAKIINGNYHKKGKKQQSIEEYAKEHGYV
jgi:hypothetical protein